MLSMLMMDLPCTPFPVGRMSGRGGNACKSSRETEERRREEGEGEWMRRREEIRGSEEVRGEEGRRKEGEARRRKRRGEKR